MIEPLTADELEARERIRPRVMNSLAQGDWEHYHAGLRERLPALVPVDWGVFAEFERAADQNKVVTAVVGAGLGLYAADALERLDPESILLRDIRRHESPAFFEDPWAR